MFIFHGNSSLADMQLEKKAISYTVVVCTQQHLKALSGQTNATTSIQTLYKAAGYRTYIMKS
jgi:hypothetical protein